MSVLIQQTTVPNSWSLPDRTQPVVLQTQ